LKFVIQPKQILINLLCFIVFLLFMNLGGIVSKFVFDHDSVFGLIRLFDFDTEKNIPTLYSSFALIVASILLSLIASIHKRQNSSFLPWVGLAIIFLFLAIDETTSIHNRLAAPTHDLLNTSGMFRWAWVIPYGIAVIVFVVCYLRFLVNLPVKTMILFIVSGSIFVSGAIGVEMLTAWHVELYDSYRSFEYAIFYTCEEFLEMLGIVVFIYTLLSYINIQFKSFELVAKE